MVNFDNIQSPTELTEEQKKAMELQRKMQKTVILSVTAGVLVTLGLGIVTVLVLMSFGVLTFNKNALKEDKTGQATNITQISDKLSEVDKVISEDYYGGVDTQTATDEVCKAYVASLDDEYASYYSSDEYKALNDRLDGDTFFGLGIICRSDGNNGILVESFSEGSAAKDAGVEAGDHIINIDGTDVRGMDLTVALNLIRSDQEGNVNITVVRGNDELPFTILKREVDELSVNGTMLSDGKTGYIHIDSFTRKTPEQFRSELNELKSDNNCSRVVIDLRNNTGGVVVAALDVLDQVVGKGDAGSMRYKDGTTQKFIADTDEKLELPYVVLVNKYSASASEIFAGAIQDFGESKLIGEQTYGKGVTQKIVNLKDGSAVKFTDAELFTPKGRSWNKTGLTPDITVELPSDAESDYQLEKALEYLDSIE